MTGYLLNNQPIKCSWGKTEVTFFIIKKNIKVIFTKSLGSC